MKNLLKYTSGDRTIWIIVLLISVISLLAVFSATKSLVYAKHGDNTTYYLMRHGVILAFGLVIMYLIHKIHYKYFKLFSRSFVLYIAALLLLLTLLFGASINDASRWLVIPVINMTFQTSDLAKVAVILFLSFQLAKHENDLSSFKKGFLPIFLPVLLVCGLIFPANLSTAMLLLFTSMIIMFIGGAKITHLLSISAVGLVIAILFGVMIYNYPNIMPRGATWKARIESFSQPDEKDTYQADRGKMAIASGKFFGKGPGMSHIKDFLPQAYSDFIYAIIIEEYGLIFGGLPIVFLYLIFMLRGIKIARKCKKSYPALLASGLTMLLVFQAFSNIGVAVNLFPVTGQPLPLISMGGTSIWFTSISIGIILSISRSAEFKTTKQELNHEA